MKKIFVFYAGLLYGEYTEYADFRALQVQGQTELYNGGYVYDEQFQSWYRMDMTPLLDVDVPLNLKAMLLLLT